MLTKLARIGLTAAVLVLAATTFTLAETSATPAPKIVLAQATAAPAASPNPFTWSGYVRAYDFYRQNAYGGHAAANQQSENNAIGLTGGYKFMDTGLSIGASYMYASPLSSCTTAASNVYPALNSNACYQSKAPGKNGAPGYATLTNPDNTLPSFEMSTLYQAFLQYNANGLYVKGGDQVINTPWANAGDSRLKPISFQGVDASYKFGAFTVEGADFWQWECRTCSDFDHGTLLTALSPVLGIGDTGTAFNGYAGASAYPTNYYNPYYTEFTNNGFEYGRLGYAGPKDLPLTANLYYYGYSDIANAIWADAKYYLDFTGKYKVFIAAQGGSEWNPGGNGVWNNSNLLGTINASVAGAQVGFNPLQDVLLTGGFDYMPWQTATVTLPTGDSCTADHVISVKSSYKEGTLPYFLPSGGTGNCTPGVVKGTANIYYGGWASPYTDSYAIDPLFTTGGTQGMIDRRSAGASFKVAGTFTSADKQFFLTLAQEWYDYNNPAYAQSTTGTDVDTEYFFSHMPKHGPYHGLSFRVRLFSRSETYFPGSSAVSLFKYSRFQAEYDF